ncbi:MAG: hypothetical protein HY544_02195 [Candidatus Diapherotrites archaeon]|uniref:Uncharacterized protein n=1 Tax=Candidatus Iainarchaeum sp. TaxID=3101447 RepID=A0A8T3YLW2_9ARCH|nr:hypothetical protein [Candidatus Diapherotrites archaeon]
MEQKTLGIVFVAFALLMLPALATAALESFTKSTTPIFTNLQNVTMSVNAKSGGHPAYAHIIVLDDTVTYSGSKSQLRFSMGQTGNGVISCRFFVEPSSGVPHGNIIVCDDPQKVGTEQITLNVQTPSGTYDLGYVTINVVPGNVPLQTTSQGTLPQPGNTAPSFTPIGAIYISANSGRSTNLVDLWSYVSDIQDSDAQLALSVVTGPYCFIDNGRYISCDAPSGHNYTNTYTLTVQARDTSGAIGTAGIGLVVLAPPASFTPYYPATPYPVARFNDYYPEYYPNYYPYQYNRPPVLSGIPDITARQNQGYAPAAIDLLNFATDPDDSIYDLGFTILRQSDTQPIRCGINGSMLQCEPPNYGYYGTNTITVQVRDRAGATDTTSFDVDVLQQGTGYCSGISVSASSVYMGENESRSATFYVRNDSYSDFIIDGVDLSDNSTFVTLYSEGTDSVARPGQSAAIRARVQSFSVPYSVNANGTVRVRGHFTGGTGCGYYDTRQADFTIRIDDTYYGTGYTAYNAPSYDNYYYTTCGSISVSAQDVMVQPNARTSLPITLTNNSGIPFNVSSMSVNESNAYFNARIESKPATIPAYGSAAASVIIDAQYSPSINPSGPVTVYVYGNFTNGASCSGSSISKAFNAGISGSGGAAYVYTTAQQGTGNAGSLDITLSDSFVTLEKGAKRNVTATIRNNGQYGCFSLSASTSGVFMGSTSGQLCIGAGESKDAPIEITARNEGSGSMEFKAAANDTSKSKFISIEVKPAAKEEGMSVIARNVPAKATGRATITLGNIGQGLDDVTVNASGLPNGVTVASVSKSYWKQGEDLELEARTGAYDGKVTASIVISSKQGTRTLPIEFTAAADKETQGVEIPAQGLAGLATTAGTAVGFIILIILAILGIISIVRKK